MKELQPNGSYKRVKISKSLRAGFKKDKCRYCHSTENLTIDHKIPVCQGGTNSVKNLQTLCYRCNGMKGGMSNQEVKRLFKWHIQVIVEKEYNKKKLSPHSPLSDK